MCRNRLTREDIINLKRRRKKKLKLIAGSVISVIVVLGLVVFLICNHRLNTGNNNLKGGEITVGSRADIGNGSTSSGVSVQTDTDADISDIENSGEEVISSEEAGTSEEAISSQEVIDSDFIFEVPDTSLPAVENIDGDNWYDESFYEKSGDVPVDMTYFNDTVFIGDSRTEGLLLYSGIPYLNGFCYKGLSVDKLDSDASIVIPGDDKEYTCYDAISNTQFDNYYCMFGVNELGWVSPDVFIDDFSELIDHIFSVNRDAVVYVESILPVTKESSDESDIYTQERIDEYNDLLLSMCQERKDVIYLDLAAAVSNESGYLPDEASTDGIHCNSDYCKRMIEYIRYNTFKRK